MRLKVLCSFSVLAGFLMTLAIGCSEGTEVKLAPAPMPPEAPKTDPPKDPKRGGGPGGSGNMKKNPGASF